MADERVGTVKLTGQVKEDTDYLKQRLPLASVRVNLSTIDSVVAYLSALRDEKYAEIAVELGGVRVNSHADLAVALTKKYGRTFKSVAAEMIKDLPIAGAIGDYKAAVRGHSQLTESVVLDASDTSGMVFLRGVFDYDKALTARIYTHDFNVQQLQPEARHAVIPTKDGNQFLYGDYSALEMRILFAITEQEWSGGDVHTETARAIFKLSNDVPVNKEQRELAKIFNYAVTYGSTAGSLASKISGSGYRVSEADAQGFIDAFFEKFPKISEFIARQHKAVDDAIKKKTDLIIAVNGGLERHLSFKELKADPEKAKRIAVNTWIQGFSGELIRNKMRKLLEAGLDVKLTVHDSFLVELLGGQDEEKARKIITTPFLNLDLTNAVEFRTGKTWGEAMYGPRTFKVVSEQGLI